MKTLLIGVSAVSLVLAGRVASARSPAAPLRVGGSIDYYEVMRTYALSGTDITEHYDAIGGTVLADMKYVRVGLGAWHNFGNMITFRSGREEKDPGYRIAAVQSSLLAKYPFVLEGGDVTLWPELGLRGDYVWQNRYVGQASVKLDPAPHDLQLMAGGGLDWAVTPDLALTGTLGAWYTLTPSSFGGAESPRGFGASLGAGLLVNL
jgi:hypothetical protein